MFTIFFIISVCKTSLPKYTAQFSKHKNNVCGSTPGSIQHSVLDTKDAL
jgi:hypothetical protein